MLDIVTVGGGGGSIIWIDDGGMLRVGPRSAGADPGPACYGRGGKEATITDAQVVLGAVRPAAFLGGRMKIDPEAARAVLAPLATHFGLTVEGMAESAIKLVDGAWPACGSAGRIALWRRPGIARPALSRFAFAFVVPGSAVGHCTLLSTPQRSGLGRRGVILRHLSCIGMGEREKQGNRATLFPIRSITARSCFALACRSL